MYVGDAWQAEGKWKAASAAWACRGMNHRAAAAAAAAAAPDETASRAGPECGSAGTGQAFLLTFLEGSTDLAVAMTHSGGGVNSFGGYGGALCSYSDALDIEAREFREARA